VSCPRGSEIGRERVETQPKTAAGENCAWLTRGRLRHWASSGTWGEEMGGVRARDEGVKGGQRRVQG
jgi:hypothetical protein